MKQFIQNLLRDLHLEALPSKVLLRGYRRQLRKKRLPANSIRVMNEYNEPVRKLHIGCGNNVLPTWLNSDFEPDHFGRRARIRQCSHRVQWATANDKGTDEFFTQSRSGRRILVLSLTINDGGWLVAGQHGHANILARMVLADSSTMG